ncbi:MAG: helicase-associated domain-containing protein [Chloroflexi bacterium]|nr:helicase-associated domain-containing protein [Chloroflexota bacterium]
MSRGGRNIQPRILEEFLNNYTVPMLKELAQLLASNLPTRKAEIVAIVRENLENPNRLQELWDELDELQQAAVSEVVHSPSNDFDSAGFRAKYSGDPDWGKFSRYGGVEKPSLLHLFIYSGVMPLDLKGRLKAFVPPPRAVQVNTVEEPPATVPQMWHEYDYQSGKSKQHTADIPVIQLETERIAQHDVHAVLRLIDADKVRVSAKTKRATAASRKALAKVLQGGDFYPPEENPDDLSTDPGHIKAFAWPLIVQSAGLANLSGSKLQLTRAGKQALASPPHEALRKAWNRWLKTKLLDEFNRVHTIKGQTGTKGKRAMTAAAGRRDAIVEALAMCPPHQWIAFDEFSRFVRASGCTFEVARDLWTLYIQDSHYGSLEYSGYGGWNILQGLYMLTFLFEYAATMGLIDVAYIHPSGARKDYGDLWGMDDLDCLSRYDGLLYIRVNGLGAWCLEMTDEYTPSLPEVQHTLKVLPNMDVVATEPLPPGDALILELFAEQTSDVVWKIEPARLLEAIEQGHSVADVETFLKAKSGGSLPGTVEIFFQETADRASRLKDRGPARLIEAQDEALAQLIANDSRLRSLCMLAGERHIVVSESDEKAFRRALHELGYSLPA